MSLQYKVIDYSTSVEYGRTIFIFISITRYLPTFIHQWGDVSLCDIRDPSVDLLGGNGGVVEVDILQLSLVELLRNGREPLSRVRIVADVDPAAQV